MFDEREPAPRQEGVSEEALDRVLTAQLAVAWAGESGDEDEARLGWWRSNLGFEFGGEDLFRKLLPHTWEWAVLQGAREAARLRDAQLRKKHHAPDQVLSLFRLGFELDEAIDERLQDLKRSGRTPAQALPELGRLREQEWDQSAFEDWLRARGQAAHTTEAIGRRLKETPEGLAPMADALTAALCPLAKDYPLPHVLRGGKA